MGVYNYWGCCTYRTYNSSLLFMYTIIAYALLQYLIYMYLDIETLAILMLLHAIALL